MIDVFTLKSRAILSWLVGVCTASSVLAALRPPAFWLAALGGVLLVTGLVANSSRTNQWYSWQREGSLNWFEGWATSTGAILAIVPLTFAVIRDLVGK
jgi:predicted membrane channel-forming protein YqfA (hemolysin III family)